MIHPEVAPAITPANTVAEPGASNEPKIQDRWEARRELARYRAETDRLRVLIDFLSRPVHAHGGTEPDPDILTAYNLAVEAALREVRRATTMEG